MFAANHPVAYQSALAVLSAAHAVRRELVAVLTLDLKPGQKEVQLIPDGVFRSRDGRPEGLPGWTTNPPRLLARLRARKIPFVIDYEHQTLHTEKNGQPAPASGWIYPATIEYRQGEGFFAPIKWTPRAQAMIDGEEYKFLSPVLAYDGATGEVLDLRHLALTNDPGLDVLAPVAALAAHYDLDPPSQENTVNREQLITLLGLATAATEAQISTALVALKARADNVDALQTEVAALKTAGSGAPDPAKYVPVGVVSELQGQLAALKTRTDAGELAVLVQHGIDEGKLIGDEHVAWARSLDVVALKAYLDKAPSVAALRGTQTGGVSTAGDGSITLHGESAQVAAQFGNSAEDLKKYGGLAS